MTLTLPIIFAFALERSPLHLFQAAFYRPPPSPSVAALTKKVISNNQHRNV